MKDLVGELRRMSGYSTAEIGKLGADEIELLRRDNGSLRGHLRIAYLNHESEVEQLRSQLADANKAGWDTNQEVLKLREQLVSARQMLAMCHSVMFDGENREKVRAFLLSDE